MKVLSQSEWKRLWGPQFTATHEAGDKRQEFIISRPVLARGANGDLDFLPFVCGDLVVLHHEVRLHLLRDDHLNIKMMFPN